MKILFSAVGTTDPLGNNSDGSIIQIIKHEHPNQVYLY